MSSEGIDLTPPTDISEISNFKAQLFKIVDPSSIKPKGSKGSKKKMSGGMLPSEVCGEYTPEQIKQIKEHIIEQYHYVKNDQKYATAFISPYYSQVQPIYQLNPDIRYPSDLFLVQDNIGSSHNLTTEPDKFASFYLNKIFDKKKNEHVSRFDYTFDNTQPLIFNQTLFEAALPIPMNEISEEDIVANHDLIKNAPLVMIITAKSMEHAIIFIIHCNILYTAGFGYSGKNPSSLQRVPGIRNSLTHNFESMIGAIYTSDYLQPSEQHKCQIVWVGLLDTQMCTNMGTYLASTTSISYNLQFPSQLKDEPLNDPPTADDYDTMVYLSPKAILTIDDAPYCQLANLGPSANIQMNCLKWAVTMLNANIYCGPSAASIGILSKPSTCRQVNEDQINEIFNNWINPHKSPLELIHTLKTVQGILANGMGYLEQLFASYECIRGRPVQGGRRKAKRTQRKKKKARRTRKA